MTDSPKHDQTENFFDNKKLKLASYLYENTKLASNYNFLSRLRTRLYAYLWRFLIKTKILTDDPIVKVKIGNKQLLMKSSHNLPSLLLKLPYYDSALSRIALFVKQKYNKLTMIDIGANIGDTVSLITDVVQGNFLCVEPDGGYFELLKVNTQNLENVICEKAIISLSDDNDVTTKTLAEVAGTAYLTNGTSEGSNTTLTTTIDSLVNKYPEFSQTNLLKIDTDGYDIKCIKSAVSLLTTTKPIIYIEFSPWHLINIGSDDPLSLFEQLLSIGYSLALFYDNYGYPFMHININQAETLKQLILYAKRKPNFYYDILMFHDSRKDGFDELYLSEISCFPDFKWY